MKKHFVVMRTENGLVEGVVFSELSGRELKKSNPNILTVISSERVPHPSPELLVKALNTMGVDVAKMYRTCYELSLEQAAPDAETPDETPDTDK